MLHNEDISPDINNNNKKNYNNNNNNEERKRFTAQLPGPKYLTLASRLTALTTSSFINYLTLSFTSLSVAAFYSIAIDNDSSKAPVMDRMRLLLVSALLAWSQASAF